MTSNRRAAFSLVELLVVIAILLILSGLAFAVFGTGKSSDRMRSGARTAQSAFMGAKDRALHAKDLRGVRLTHDATNVNLVNGFVYLQPLPIQSAGYTGTVNPADFSIQRGGLPANTDATQITVLLTDVNGNPTEWQSLLAQDTNGIWPSGNLQIRIPSAIRTQSGQWFQLARQSPSPPYWWIPDPNNNNQALLFLQTGYPGGNPSPAAAIPFGSINASCDIQLGNDVLPFHQPITLPSGCVIDLYRSQIPTTWYQQQSVLPNNVPNGWVVCCPDPNVNGNVIVRLYTSQMDVMFSPRGNVSGAVGALGAMYFLLRDLRDATKDNLQGFDPALLSNQGQMAGDMLILAVFPQTGLVSTFEASLMDANNDGIIDDLFALAKAGQSAGR
jgi:prepilin-type N-terminal cleavage/methylation domain-containing protein